MTTPKKELSGYFLAQDQHNNNVTVEWYQTDIFSPTLASFKNKVSTLAAQVTASSEMRFLQTYPEAISTGSFLKSCEPLFAHGIHNVDWNQVKATLQSTIQQFYLMDISLFGSAIINQLINDVYFFVSIKDQKTETLLGYMMTSITPALPKGDIKLINVVITPEKQNLNLEALLINSITKVMPHIKRIFVTVRPTDINTITALKSCGFVTDLNPIQDPNHPINMDHFVVLEYKVNF